MFDLIRWRYCLPLHISGNVLIPVVFKPDMQIISLNQLLLIYRWYVGYQLFQVSCLGFVANIFYRLPMIFFDLPQSSTYKPIRKPIPVVIGSSRLTGISSLKKPE
jgi:hypothetical protein